MLAGKQARTQGGRIMIAAMRPLVAEIFQISRFTMLFEIYPGVREALTAASPPGGGRFRRRVARPCGCASGERAARFRSR